MPSSVSALLTLCLAVSVHGQDALPRAASDPSTFGTVTGHVYFSGSNLPARLVDVGLQPLALQPLPQTASGKHPALSFTIHQTGLDGGYTIPSVAPGAYFVVVREPGFLSPFAQFTPEELAHPTSDTARRMAAVLPAVSVRPGATSILDVYLQRGATLGGTVHFDDGTPFVGTRVSLQRHENGTWGDTAAYSERA